MIIDEFFRGIFAPEGKSIDSVAFSSPPYTGRSRELGHTPPDSATWPSSSTRYIITLLRHAYCQLLRGRASNTFYYSTLLPRETMITTTAANYYKKQITR